MEFDVFLSHNSEDKPAVRRLAARLKKENLTVWLDEEELTPGDLWQRLLEEGVRNSKSIAVLIGKDGLGPWEDEEMQGALQLAVKEKRRLIPVLLPDVGQAPELPMFLGNRTWVDLRRGLTKEGIANLIWGITSNKPSGQSSAEEGGITSSSKLDSVLALPELEVPSAWIRKDRSGKITFQARGIFSYKDLKRPDLEPRDESYSIGPTPGMFVLRWRRAEISNDIVCRMVSATEFIEGGAHRWEKIGTTHYASVSGWQS